MTATESTPTEHTRTHGPRVLGTLRTADGTGVVHLEDRYPTDAADLWSALTDPARLRRWLGEVEGDLHPGGAFRAHFVASGWEGSGHVEVCEPPRRLVVHTSSPDQPHGVIEAVLTPDGDGTRLVVEDRGMPVDQLPAYGAGDQIHVEDLAAYLAGGEPCDARARWQELHPAYQTAGVEKG